MANKYIRHGATYCGDGTSPDLATSNGAPGAWNNINILEGTTPPYGVLAAGDVVYIRSKNESGAAITRTMATSITIGSAAATLASPITWVIDDGTVWSGVDGVITWTTSSTYSLTFRLYNQFLSSSGRKFKYLNTSNTMTDNPIVNVQSYVKIRGLHVDLSAKTNLTYIYNAHIACDGFSELENPYVIYGKMGGQIITGIFSCSNTHGPRKIINPQVEILIPTANGMAVFATLSDYTSSTKVFGGKVYGSGATTGQVLVNPSGYAVSNQGAEIQIVGFDFPKTMSVANTATICLSAKHQIDITGCDGGYGAHFERSWGYVTSRSDNNPPTLSATLPDSNLTPWSWRVYPWNTDRTNPAELFIETAYQGDPAQKTVTLELLVENTMSATKENTWMEVVYTDSSNERRCETTRVPLSTNDLDVSTANWSATTWGASTFVKRKLSLTTAYAIKKDATIVVRFCTELKSANSLQILFIDPEVKVL